MEKLAALLEQVNEQNFIRLIMSGSREKQLAQKVTFRPVQRSHKGGEETAENCILFQETVHRNAQVFHRSYSAADFRVRVCEWMRSMRQMVLETTEFEGTVLTGKKGTVTVKVRRRTSERTQPLTHNRIRNYLLPEGEKIDFLVDLGVMNEQGKIVHAYYDKFRQINRFLEFIRDILPELQKNREITIIDFGCGKSYLTFAMYYYLHLQNGLDVRMIGLDLKKEVIDRCNTLARKYDYRKLTFLQGDIAEYQGVDRADMVVTLHACDTATDLALAKAVRWNAKVILSVPCCQHELNGQIHCDMLQPILQYGIVKERSAALFTDGLRGELLKQHGYRVTLSEFIDMEHTPKNILIRAVYTGRKPTDQEREAYKRTCAFLGVRPMLDRLFEQ